MRRFPHWYGASPLHLLTMIGSFALAGYAAAELLPNNFVGIPVWFAAAVIGHDLLLMPLYTFADRSVLTVFRHRRPELPAVPWINYLRVPAVLSGLLLLIWFPLIFRLPTRFPATTTLSLDPYLWRWLAVTGALFLLSAAALALRLGAARRRTRNGRASAGPGPEITSPSAIAEHVTEIPAAIAAKPPNDAMDAVAREPANLAASGPAGTVQAGTVLPDAELLDVHGTATTLYAAAGNGTSVLVFYRGAWCLYCKIALSAYQDQLLPQLTERGIRLVAISPQRPDGSLAMQQEHSRGFAVVSDPGNIIAGRLGIRTQPAEEALPMPAIVILDATRTVRWIDVHPDYSTRTESRQIIGVLDHLEH